MLHALAARMKTNRTILPAELRPALDRLFGLAIGKSRDLAAAWPVGEPPPVFTVAGRYAARGWTQWTQGFQYGCCILAFEATGETALLELARQRTVAAMAAHLTHAGVHDHGFNTLSTYGNLRRLMRQGRIAANECEMAFYELAIKTSGAVQANRWAKTHDGGGYIYSFNGPHSLFIDTLRTLRVLGLAHQLGQVLMGENDQRISLLDRMVAHGLTTARHNIYYGQGRDGYDLPALRGRTAQEAIFNANDGRFRCPSSQQGYSPWTTWTRGLAWAVLGFAEELEFLKRVDAGEFHAAPKTECLAMFQAAAMATADYYIHHAAAADGIPYWDTGAPGLRHLEGWKNRPADPFNDDEPVDSSAAAIAAQGLIRLGRYLGSAGKDYFQAGLTVAATLLAEPYLAVDARHQGLLLHSVYHRPNGWDYLPPGRKVPCGESSLWGDYHLLELGVLIRRLADGGDLTFFDAPESMSGGQ
jgi:unsaturated chondroitin disaccharide hydrolase